MQLKCFEKFKSKKQETKDEENYCYLPVLRDFTLNNELYTSQCYVPKLKIVKYKCSWGSFWFTKYFNTYRFSFINSCICLTFLFR